MKYKVLVATRSFGGTSLEPWRVLDDGACEAVTADLTKGLTDDQFKALLQDADGLIIGGRAVTADIINSAPRLKVISMHGVGVDHIDLIAAKERGIAVANCPGTNEESVADLVFGVMLALARRIPAADRELRAHKWGRFTGVELWAKVLGIVGLGRIGRAVARRAGGFSMEVLAYDPYVTPEQAASVEVKLTTFEELLARSDSLTLHVPLTAETRGMIGWAELQRMKPTAYLINAARGGLVDEEALYEALVQGLIAGAALDSFSQEPPWESPLLELENVVVTPHIGGHTREAIERVGVMAARNVVEALQGRQPLHRVV